MKSTKRQKMREKLQRGYGRGEFGRGMGPGRGGYGPRFGPGFGPGGFRPEFGPGFDEEGPGFGPGRHGGRHGGRGPGGRRGRGNVRAAVLALLAEEPRHGYAIMTELAERSGGMWKPSPGSVYPVLQQLQDEGLVTADETGGKKVFSLTDPGRALVAANPAEFDEPWKVSDEGGRARFRAMFEAVGGLGMAAREVSRHGTPDQVQKALEVLDDARRAMYRLLAEPPSPSEQQSSPAAETAGETPDPEA